MSTRTWSIHGVLEYEEESVTKTLTKIKVYGWFSIWLIRKYTIFCGVELVAATLYNLGSLANSIKRKLTSIYNICCRKAILILYVLLLCLNWRDGSLDVLGKHTCVKI